VNIVKPYDTTLVAKSEEEPKSLLMIAKKKRKIEGPRKYLKTI